MDLTTRLRAACGHDSRSVDGCINCESADEIERLRTHAVVLAATTEEVERQRCARLCDGIAAGYTGAARRLDGQHATHAAGQRDGANECASAIRRA